MTPERLSYSIGSTIGLVGGSVFVLLNRSALPNGLSIAALVVWIIALCAAIYAVWIKRISTAGDPTPPSPSAGKIYGASCLGMLALIFAGSRILDANGHAAVIPALVAVAVGLHFLPFAKAFSAHFFYPLGGAVAGVGLLGVLLGLMVDERWAAGDAVMAGLVMVCMIPADAFRRSRQIR